MIINFTDFKAKSSRLPEGYQEVEWISGNGSPYFRLPKIPYRYELDYQALDTGIQRIMGRESSGVWSWRSGIYEDVTNGKISFNDASSNNNWKTFSGYTGGQRHIVKELNNRHIIIDGVDKGAIATGTVGEPPFAGQLFAQASESGNTVYGYANVKIWSLKFFDTDNTTVTYDFIPCYRISDSIVGMYEIKHNVFYTTTQGAFQKGGDVL